MTNQIAAIAVASTMLGIGAPAAAATIDWVNWTDGGGTGSYLINGTGSGLNVTGSFTAKTTGSGSNWFNNSSVNISDGDWPYSNTNLSFWQAYKSGAYNTTATFDFTNTGGLAAGGSLAMIDVENAPSSIAVRGYQWTGSSYQLVSVNWAYNVFTINPSSLQAVWNSSTNTLTGAGGTLVGGIDTFSMLTSDTRLDRIELTISMAGDGFGIGFTSANINAATNGVPLPGAAGVAACGLIGLARRRRR